MMSSMLEMSSCAGTSTLVALVPASTTALTRSKVVRGCCCLGTVLGGSVTAWPTALARSNVMNGWFRGGWVCTGTAPLPMAGATCGAPSKGVKVGETYGARCGSGMSGSGSSSSPRMSRLRLRTRRATVKRRQGSCHNPSVRRGRAGALGFLAVLEWAASTDGANDRNDLLAGRQLLVVVRHPAVPGSAERGPVGNADLSRSVIRSCLPMSQ